MLADEMSMIDHNEFSAFPSFEKSKTSKVTKKKDKTSFELQGDHYFTEENDVCDENVFVPKFLLNKNEYD